MTTGGGAKGFTTGSAAAAASVAALRFLKGEGCSSVELLLPGGERLAVPVTGCARTENGSEAWVTKNAGDDPDVTHGAVVVSSIELFDSIEGAVCVEGGKGVGVVTKPGLPVAPGNPAINPGPMALIKESLKRELPEGSGIRTVISIPDGEALAKRTYNPRLGIVGGLSILGTTGIVSPMSSEAIVGTIRSELSVLAASGTRMACLVPGNYGRRMAESLGVPDDRTVNVSNFIGESLGIVDELGFETLIVIGQVGKFAKLSAGSLDTHSAKSDGRLEALAAFSALHGAAQGDVRGILDATTADEAASEIAGYDWGRRALHELVERVSAKVLAKAQGLRECAALVFALPDRELARTSNLARFIFEICENGGADRK